MRIVIFHLCIGLCACDSATHIGRDIDVHSGVSSLAFAQNNKTVIAGLWKDERSVRIFDVQSGAECASFDIGCFGPCLALSKAEELIAVGTGRKIDMWNVKKQTKLFSLEGHSERITSVLFFDDDRFLASTSLDGTVRIWDCAKKREHARLAGHEGSVYAVAVCPKGKYAVSAGFDKKVLLWDLLSKETIRVFNGASGTIYGVCFSRDGSKILSVGSRTQPGKKMGEILAWNIDRETQIGSFGFEKGYFITVARSPKNEVYACGASNGQIVLLNADLRKEKILTHGTGMVLSLAFSTDGNRLVSGSGRGPSEGSIRFWDMAVSSGK